MNDKVTHVITDEPWDKNFDDVSQRLNLHHTADVQCLGLSGLFLQRTVYMCVCVVCVLSLGSRGEHFSLFCAAQMDLRL